MLAKIITIKRSKDLNYFSLCALNLFNTQVSQFELNYWNKWTFPRHSNLLRCTCIAHKSYGQKEQHALSSAYQLFNSTEGSHENVTFWGELSILFLSDAVTKHKFMPHDYHTHSPSLSLTPRNMTTVQTRNSPPITPAAIMYPSFCKEKQTMGADGNLCLSTHLNLSLITLNLWL